MDYLHLSVFLIITAKYSKVEFMFFIKLFSVISVIYLLLLLLLLFTDSGLCEIKDPDRSLILQPQLVPIFSYGGSNSI